MTAVIVLFVFLFSLKYDLCLGKLVLMDIEMCMCFVCKWKANTHTHTHTIVGLVKIFGVKGFAERKCHSYGHLLTWVSFFFKVVVLAKI